MSRGSLDSKLDEAKVEAPTRQDSKLSQVDEMTDTSRNSSVMIEKKEKEPISILKKSKRYSEEAQFRQRKDSYGVDIEPESKKHRLWYKESANQVLEVENWKDYNKDHIDGCPCTIF